MRRAVSRLLTTGSGSAIHRVVIAPLDAPLMRLSRGRVHFVKGTIPLVLLRTTGARSGVQRDVPLGYFTDGDDVILIASNYGQVRHPGWFHNLRADPRAALLVGGTSRPVDARLTAGAQRERLWARALEIYPGWAAYRARVPQREIGVFLLRAVG